MVHQYKLPAMDWLNLIYLRHLAIFESLICDKYMKAYQYVLIMLYNPKKIMLYKPIGEETQ